MVNDMELLRIEGLSARYFKAEVINKVNINVGEREIVTILGSNGAGKTTILRAVSGIKVKRRGKVYFEEKEIQHLGPDEILRLGVAHVPEGRGIFAGMSVGENLRMGAYIRGDREGIRRDEERILGLFPILKDRYRQMAGSLSGGEQQMVALGRGLMSNPKLIMLDEPSLGLAPLVVSHLAEIISQLKDSDVSVLLVEQNSEIALEVADRGYVLENGKIALEGFAGDLINNPYIKTVYLGG